MSKSFKLGVVGNGFVGKALGCLKCEEIEVKAFDLDPKQCNPIGTTFKEVCSCDIVFVSVPTPMRPNGSAHIKIVEDVVKKIQSEGCQHIVIRSTVPPGTTRDLGVYFMPEFLTEKNFLQDFRDCQTRIIGLDTKDAHVVRLFRELFVVAFKNGVVSNSRVEFCTTTEAELLKYFRNTYLAMKVSFCNEFASICEGNETSYEAVRELAVLDPRITPSHTKVPGPDGKHGFGGTCFPKDIHALLASASAKWVACPLLEAVITRNEKLDRPEKDWKLDEGRAVVKQDELS